MAPSWASLTPHWMPAGTWGQPGSEVPEALSPGVHGTRQGLEMRLEAGPARGAWGPRSLPPSPCGSWPAPAWRRCLQTPSCVAASPGRECPQSSTPQVRTSLQTLCIRGGVNLSASPPIQERPEMKACLAPALRARLLPPQGRAWNHLCRTLWPSWWRDLCAPAVLGRTGQPCGHPLAPACWPLPVRGREI